MPFARRKAQPPQPIDPADWRPQAMGTGRGRSVADPIIEPNWSGVRVLARVARGTGGTISATFTDEAGLDATEEFAELAGAVADAALVDDLVLDGYLTVQPTQDTVGTAVSLPKSLTGAQLMAQMVGGSHSSRPEPAPRLDPERPIAFVAIDLLSIDGSSLIDISLLERKRLLDGALAVGELVRITPYVRPPVGSLLATWHALGFRELVYKPANSRYLPTGEPGDWALWPIINR